VSIQTPTSLAPHDYHGVIGILNVGVGDTKVSFDKEKPEERKRAAQIVTDMLRMGYAILVQVGEKEGKPLYMRAESFDPETCEYLIVGLPQAEATEPETDEETSTATPKKRGRKAKASRVPADSTRATAVARSAGG
jgi:hypothetical protein